MFCAIHGEPFREEWPRGGMLFQLKAIEALFAMDALWEEIRAHTGRDPGPSSKEEIEAALDRKPVCCRLSGDTLLETYRWQHAQGGIGRKGFCSGCGAFGLGASYRFVHSGGAIKTLPHVCFACVAKRIVPAAS